MANTITNVTPQLLAQGLLALREQAIMPRLVSRNYDTMAVRKGAVINIPLPSAITARAVTPSVTMNSNVDSSPTVAYVTLNQFYEAPFQLSDTDFLSVQDGFVPMEASEAVKALINTIDKHILGKHVKFYGAAGTAGTTPFATNISAAGTARKLLNKQLAPTDGRVVVLDPDAESNALLVSNVLQFDQRGDQGGIINGSIGRKLGMQWYMDQNITSYTKGTAWVTGYSLATGGAAVNATSVSMINSTATGTVNVGDIFTLSGDAQQYVVTSVAAVTATTNVTFYIYPALASTYASGAAATVVGSHVPNLVFHPGAIAFASRPLMDISGIGNLMASNVDPISGVALRIETSRQYKQTTFSYDALWGADVVRRELGAKILG